jgi:nucleoside-diphosphate-sugar epimerase
VRVVVLGATGGTGLEIVRQAIDRGHSVTAFVRSPERLKPFRDRITVKQGNLLSSSDLAAVLKDQDAVLSAFGPRLPIAKGEKKLLQQFAASLTPAMIRSGVKRVIVESSAFLFRDSVLPQHTFSESCSFQALWQMSGQWRKFSREVNWIGRWSGLRSLLTDLGQANTEFEKAIYRDSDSQFPGPMWRTAS